MGVATTKENIVYMYNPKLWTKKKTRHKPSDVATSIAHQIGHIYFSKNKIKSPIWFEEGYVTYISDEKNKAFRKKELRKLVKRHGISELKNLKVEFNKHPIPALYYQSSFNFIAYLIELRSKKKIIDLIEMLKNGSEFETSFSRVFKKSSEKAWQEFNNTLIK